MMLETSSQSLKANIMTLPSGKFVTAGQNQFLTLWTRDFCHAVRGLVTIGETDVAKNHLSFLLKNLREDGLVPRVLDNRVVQFRVAWQSFRKLCPIVPKLAFKEPLIPQYKDEHGSNAFDSNVLLILSVLRLDDAFFKSHETELKKVWNWYDDKFKDGLLYQTAFADWQDTTKREGQTFLLNLFYFLAASKLKSKNWDIKINLDELKTKINSTFFRNGLYISQVGYPQVSIEGNLFALESDDFLSKDEKKSLWENLKAHPIISLDGVIGRCSYPDWPEDDLAWHIKFANLKRYHGSLSWSWLMGLGLKVSKIMNDEVMTKKQIAHIEKLLKRDGEVYEVYDPEKGFLPWGSWLIKSEHPFAWGSGYLVDALASS
jgi:hypothetical protein